VVPIRFDLVDLQLFIHVAEAGSITAGANRAHTALASASARIRGMENAIGIPLLARKRQGIELTPAGRTLLHHARIVIHQLESMHAELGQYVKGIKGSIRLLCNTAALTELVREGLSAFLAENPDIDVHLEERLSDDIAQAIADGAADVGIVSESADLTGLETFSFGSVRLMLVTGKRHPLGNRSRIRFVDTLEHEFVGVEGSALQEFLAKTAARAGKRLKYRVLLPSFDVVCRMIERGVGIGVVPASAAIRSQESMAIRLIELQEPWAFRNLKICVRRLDDLPAYTRELIKSIRT
jgi:DNA-binding transcriptional LysR family regulator